MIKPRNYYSPLQAARHRLAANLDTVRRLNAVEAADPRRKTSVLVLEACVIAYAPQLLSTEDHQRHSTGKYILQRSDVEQSVMEQMRTTSTVRGVSIAKLIEDAVIQWLDTNVHSVVTGFDGTESALFFSDVAPFDGPAPPVIP
jgi:hypothetical protein